MRVGWVSATQDTRVASFRYRVLAPIAGLKARGQVVDVCDPAGADDCDVVVFSKAYGVAHRDLALSVKRRGGRVVFDLCDNHFYNPYDLPKYRRAREELGEMMSIADQVVCSTRPLADVVTEETNGSVRPIVIGDIAERLRLRKRSKPRGAEDSLRLMWFGSHGSPNAPSGMTDLLLIREALESLAAKRPVELTVCSNSREKFEREIATLRLPTHYVEWSLETFPGLLARTDAAVMPMTVNPFTACKTHNRLTTAIYAGVPTIASSIESYREFDNYCTLDDWDGGLEALAEDVEAERRRALASREHIDRRWTSDVIASQWEAALGLPAASRAKEVRLSGLTLQGHLDAVARDAVTGWVRAPARPDLRLQVVLECDGAPVGVALADRTRNDLKAAGLQPDCGFSLPLPPRLAREASSITVRVLEFWLGGG